MGTRETLPTRGTWQLLLVTHFRSRTEAIRRSSVARDLLPPIAWPESPLGLRPDAGQDLVSILPWIFQHWLGLDQYGVVVQGMTAAWCNLFFKRCLNPFTMTFDETSPISDLLLGMAHRMAKLELGICPLH